MATVFQYFGVFTSHKWTPLTELGQVLLTTENEPGYQRERFK